MPAGYQYGPNLPSIQKCLLLQAGDGENAVATTDASSVLEVVTPNVFDVEDFGESVYGIQ